MEKLIKIKGTIVKEAPAKVGYCYTLKENKTNKQYFFFNTWKLELKQSAKYTCSLQAKAGKDKYYLFLLKCQELRQRKWRKVYRRVVNQHQDLDWKLTKLTTANKQLGELSERQKWEIKILKQLLETKQREIDNKPEYQAQNIFDHLSRVYYKSEKSTTEKQLLEEVNNLLNDTYIGKKWIFDFRMKQNYWK